MRLPVLLAACFPLVAISGAMLAAQPSPKPDEVAELYRSTCQPCHGPDGDSVLKPLSFVDHEWKHGSRTQDIARVIAEGVEATAMLPFKEKLTKEEILALARLVRSFDKSLKPESRKTPPKRKSGVTP